MFGKHCPLPPPGLPSSACACVLLSVKWSLWTEAAFTAHHRQLRLYHLFLVFCEVFLVKVLLCTLQHFAILQITLCISTIIISFVLGIRVPQFWHWCILWHMFTKQWMTSRNYFRSNFRTAAPIFRSLKTTVLGFQMCSEHQKKFIPNIYQGMGVLWKRLPENMIFHS